MNAADLVVVGGGPAGLAAAIAACRKGLRCVVLEQGESGRDKACGEGLLPDGAAALRELGVPLEGLGRPFRGIRFHDPWHGVEADFPGERGLAVRRTALHAALAEAARRAGVEVRWRSRVDGLEPGGVRTAGGTVAGGVVVGADGLHSRVRRWAGLDAAPGRHRRFGLRRHYEVAPWSERVEVGWVAGCEAYVTPVAERLVGVAMLWSKAPRGHAFEALLARFPDLAARLAGAPVASSDRGSGPFDQRSRAVARGRVALIGDAAGYVDPITGEGLGIALREALALAESLAGGGLDAYARASRQLRRLPEALTRLLLIAERRPAWRRRFFAALEREPRLFARLLAVHSRALPARRLGWGRLALAIIR